MNTETTDAELVEEPQQQAVVLRDPKTAVAPIAEERPMTSAQAKVDAVASLTMSAYQKASQLTLTAEEIVALKADFPDDAFKPGAAGKENLLYCEHAFLRDRLDAVLGMGQWALVPRNRWAEPFKTGAGKDGSRVYLEGMLMVRGCFVAEAIGEMEYYPHNASQNYGDACEGAETACLRRCCKKWGIGLQAWKKDWCEGWWKRRRNPTPPSTAAPANKTAPRPPAAQKPPPPEPAKVSDVLPPQATSRTRDWFLSEMAQSGIEEGDLLKFAQESAILLPTEVLMDWPLARVPVSKQALSELITQFAAWQKKVGPRGADGPDFSEPFWNVICPIPRKGQKRTEYLQSPDTIKSLYLAAKDGIEDARKRLFGFANNWQPEAREYNGKTYPPTTEDHAFRKALDDYLAFREQNVSDLADEMNEEVDR